MGLAWVGYPYHALPSFGMGVLEGSGLSCSGSVGHLPVLVAMGLHLSDEAVPFMQVKEGRILDDVSTGVSQLAFKVGQASCHSHIENQSPYSWHWHWSGQYPAAS